jgi:hypothetical protein
MYQKQDETKVTSALSHDHSYLDTRHSSYPAKNLVSNYAAFDVMKYLLSHTQKDTVSGALV